MARKLLPREACEAERSPRARRKARAKPKHSTAAHSTTATKSCRAPRHRPGPASGSQAQRLCRFEKTDGRPDLLLRCDTVLRCLLRCSKEQVRAHAHLDSVVDGREEVAKEPEVAELPEELQPRELRPRNTKHKQTINEGGRRVH